MLVRYIDLLKNKKETIIIKLIINFIILFIFSFVYYEYKEDYQKGDNKIDNHGDAIYFSLIIHTGLGFGDIIPDFEVNNHSGRNIVMIHLIFVILS